MSIDRESRVRLGAAAVLALVFVAGAALGYALSSGPTPAPRTADPGSMSLRDVDRKPPSDPPNEWIVDHLDLDAEQRARVDSVVEHFGARMSQIQKDYRPRYRAVVDSTDRAIRQLLTDAQRARYDSMEAAARSRRGHERDPHR